MFLIKKQKGQILSLPAKEINPNRLKLTSGLAGKILNILAKKTMYPKGIAKALGVHEQKVYYHIKRLERADLVEVVKTESKLGAVTNYYSLTSSAFALRFGEWKSTQKIAGYSNESAWLDPFIRNGRLNAIIVVGSPDPHGPEKARSRDGYYGMDLALFLGTFLNYVPGLNVKLDTEVGLEDLQNNLIIIGGPVVNSVTSKVNSSLPIRFADKCILSQVSGKKYYSDETGIIIKAKNPLEKSKMILLIAGQRYAGTRAAIIAFLQKFREIVKGNKFNTKTQARVVEGIDLDSDGIVDSVEFLE